MTTKRKGVIGVLAVGAITALFAAAYFWQSVPLVQFVPVRLNARQRLQAHSQTLTPEQCDRVEEVLKRYGERCRRAGSNAVLITLGLNGDHDLAWNYTTKAGL